jgi:predicted ATPase
MRSIGPLPQPATPLVGREAELARVKRWLRGPDVRFVTLVGAPGTGKTRLAIATAHDMLAGFEQGAPSST